MYHHRLYPLLLLLGLSGVRGVNVTYTESSPQIIYGNYTWTADAYIECGNELAPFKFSNDLGATVTFQFTGMNACARLPAI